MKTEIEQRQYKRFKVLYALYKEVKASCSIQAYLPDIAAANDIKNGTYEEAKEYLLNELFIKNGQRSEDYSITHIGKKQVEFIVTHPKQQTDNFPSFDDMGL